jgi:hypothetical protein
LLCCCCARCCGCYSNGEKVDRIGLANELLVVEQFYQLIELPEISKSSVANEPENKEKTNWMQVREVVATSSRALFGALYII